MILRVSEIDDAQTSIGAPNEILVLGQAAMVDACVMQLDSGFQLQFTKREEL